MNRAHCFIIQVHSDFQETSLQVLVKREQNDMKATKTMLLTFVLYFIGYLPSILYAILVSKGFKVDDIWFGFFASFCPFIASGCNPIIYALRTRRFRHAFSQFWKDPCGKSPLQEIKEERAVRKFKQEKPAATGTLTLNSVHTKGDVPSSPKKRENNETVLLDSKDVIKINEKKERNTGISRRCTSLPTVVYTTTRSLTENYLSENSKRKSI